MAEYPAFLTALISCVLLTLLGSIFTIALSGMETLALTTPSIFVSADRTLATQPIPQVIPLTVKETCCAVVFAPAISVLLSFVEAFSSLCSEAQLTKSIVIDASTENNFTKRIISYPFLKLACWLPFYLLRISHVKFIYAASLSV